MRKIIPLSWLAASSGTQKRHLSQGVSSRKPVHRLLGNGARQRRQEEEAKGQEKGPKEGKEEGQKEAQEGSETERGKRKKSKKGAPIPLI